MASAKGHVKALLDRAKADGISFEPSASPFSARLLASLAVSSDQSATVQQIIGALERTLNRSHDDARLVLSLCLALQDYSSLLMPDLLKKIEKALKFLDKPVPAAVVRTIKNSRAAALHPKVIDLPDLDSITALSRAPADSIEVVEGQKEILRVGTEEIDLTKSGKREIEAAVRKVKADAKKLAPSQDLTATKPERSNPTADTSLPLESGDEGEGEGDTELHFPEELSGELDEASLALSRLLRSMPRKGKLSNLALVIEEAQKLLEFTRRDLIFTRQQDSLDPVYGDLN